MVLSSGYRQQQVCGYIDLRSSLRRYPRRNGTLIAIEGFMGSGKTTTARALSRELRYPVVSLDAFVAIRGGRFAYPTRIARGRLIQAIRQATATGPAIIEGICLRAITREAAIHIGVFIYVMRVSNAGLWHDGIELEDFCNGASVETYGEPEGSDLRYHARYAPHKRAGIIFRRTEN